MQHIFLPLSLLVFSVTLVGGERLGRRYNSSAFSVQQLAVESRAFALAAGVDCIGALFGDAGNCGVEKVTSLEGESHEVTMHCFDTSSNKPDKLAGWNDEGKCFIPKNGECDEDEQCRHGTSCVPTGGPLYACQEVAADQDLDEESSAELARNIAVVVRTMARSLSESELLQESTPSYFMDKRSGAFSPFVARPPLAKQVLAAVQQSFERATVKGKDAASRSGALFVVSGDGRFLAKSVREEEYEELSENLVRSLASHCDLAHADCPPGSEESCLAKVTLARTTLNLPVLAFVHDVHYWVVMPASAPLRGLATSRGVGSLQPWGEATYYDVKPVWAKSHSRPAFMRLLTELGIHPMADDAPIDMKGQWARLEEAINRDVDFLSLEGTDDEPFIDYSLLFELYSPGRDVDISGNFCIKSLPCFGSDPTGCHVLCASIIDFYTRYDLKRQMESWVKSFKFHHYAQKTKDMLRCALSQHLNRTSTGLSIEARQSGTVELRASISHVWRSPYTEAACDPYLKMACGDLPQKSNPMDCTPWWAQPRLCMSMECTSDVEAHRLDQCASWLQTKCVQDLSDYNNAHQRSHHFSSILQKSAGDARPLANRSVPS